jgi:PPOX class probable F420-dependent enzyme
MPLGSIERVAELSAKAKRLFEDPNLLFVATVNADGSPQVTPVWTAVEDGYITFNTAIGRAKERNLRRDPRVGLSIADRDDPYETVSVVGRAVALVEGDEAVAQIDDLSEKYRGERPYADHRPDVQRVKVLVEPIRVHE